MPDLITDITIYQSNKTAQCDLLSVHNPLIFLVDAHYTGATPEALHVDVNNSNGDTLGTYTCIPYQDVSAGVRRFAFIADGILRSFMDGFEDIEQTEKTIIEIPNLTEYFELDFFDPNNELEHEAIDFYASNTSRQFGEGALQENIFNNTNMTYVSAENRPVYIYYFNSVNGAVISITDALQEYPALDYDDTFFADADDVLFYAQFEDAGPEPMLSCADFGALPLSYYESVAFNTDVYDCTFLEIEP